MSSCIKKFAAKVLFICLFACFLFETQQQQVFQLLLRRTRVLPFRLSALIGELADYGLANC